MSDRQLALLGFLLHAPGLWVLGKVRLGPALARENLYALLGTALATGVTAAVTHSGWWALGAWMTGHFVWSGLLARAALQGRLHR